MYDVGKIRKAALNVYNVAPSAGSVLVLLGGAQKAMEGLEKRREDLSTLIGYEGARQWDKDYSRYSRWLEEATVIAQKVAEPGPTTPLWADKYAKLLLQFFTGGLRAQVAYWATLANQMTALEGAQADLSEQTSWLMIWWVMPVSTLAANIAVVYDLPEIEVNYAAWKERVVPQAKKLMKTAASVGALAVAGAAIWFFWPLGVAILASRSRSAE